MQLIIMAMAIIVNNKLLELVKETGEYFDVYQ